MPINILMPALSPTMKEGNLARWLKKEGDQVRSGDVIAEIETDKATMEVEAADEGTLGKIVVPEGAQGIEVNSVIGVLLEEGEDESAIGDVSASAPKKTKEPEPKEEKTEARPAASSGNGATPPATPLARRVAEQSGVDLGSISGSGAHGKIVRADVEGASGGGQAQTASSTDKGDRIFASPVARRMAAETSLDLSTIRGSGPDGRIIRVDVEQALKGGAPVATKAPPQTGPEYEDVRVSQMRKVIAERLTESKQTIPHYYLNVDCEIDQLLAARKQLNEREGVEKLSVNDFVILAVARALRLNPRANATWHGDYIRRYRETDISVAVALEDGLITPVLRSADRKSIDALSAEMKGLAAKARDGKLTPEEYQGGSITVSNLGMYGIKDFAAVINPPQASILAVGAGEARPVVKNGQLAVATVMTLTLSADHRVVDGAMGAEFLAAIKRFIEAPVTLFV